MVSRFVTIGLLALLVTGVLMTSAAAQEVPRSIPFGGNLPPGSGGADPRGTAITFAIYATRPAVRRCSLKRMLSHWDRNAASTSC